MTGTSVHPGTPAGGLANGEFAAAFRRHPAGVALISAEVDGTRAALTATSVVSVSADPPLLAFSLSAASGSAAVIRAAETVVVHLLDADHLDLARLGAARGVDRFADRRLWSRLPTGEPFFPEAGTWIRGRRTGELQAARSTVVVVHALETSALQDERAALASPLVYHDRTWHRLDERSRLE